MTGTKSGTRSIGEARYTSNSQTLRRTRSGSVRSFDSRATSRSVSGRSRTASPSRVPFGRTTTRAVTSAPHTITNETRTTNTIFMGTSRTGLLMPCRPAFTEAVEDDDESGERVGPPRARGRVEREAHEHRHGKEAVHQGHAPFGDEHRVGECDTNARLSRGESEHDGGGESGPHDSEWAGFGVVR